MKIFWLLILLAFLAAFAWWLQWDPYRRAYREITPTEQARVDRARAYHGDYLIECEGERWVMVTEKGRVRL